MLFNYLKIAIKVLQRRKFFTFISLFGISFTLLVLNVITSFLDSFISPGGPETKLDRTLILDNVMIYGNWGSTSTDPSYYFLNRYLKPLKSAELVSIFSNSSNSNVINTYKGNEKIKTAFKYVDRQYWEILDFDFLEGNAFSEDDVKSARQIAVISKNYRKQFFNDQSPLGKFIEVEGTQYQVIGVVDDVSVARYRAFGDIYVPISTSKEDFTKFSFHGNYQGMALAKPGISTEAVRNEFNNSMKYLQFPNPDHYDKIKVKLFTQMEQLASMDGEISVSYSRTVLIALIFITLFMLLPTINLVNLNITRIMERSSEIGIRKAFGATKLRLIGQFVTENIILTLLGSVIAFILTLLVVYLFNVSGFSPLGTGYIQLVFNTRVFFVSILIALFFGLLSGVYPAYRMSRLNPVETLKGAQS
ncbi:MAG: ABC transporter permease [Calditrichaeota bacterium]|nr:ABC transporter permease [Calditrichota bacterium]